MRSFGTTVCRSIRPESTEAIQRRALHITHPTTASMSTMLDFRLFPIDVTNSVGISFRKCVIHPVAFTICCHQPVTPTSPPGSEEHLYILDLAIKPTVTNHSCTVSFKISIVLYHSLLYTHFIPSILVFAVLLCCSVVFCCG